MDTQTVYTTDTIILNKQQYIQFSLDDRFAGLITLKGDTVLPVQEDYLEFDTIDFNNDGAKDLQISLMASDKSYSTYLFDTTKQVFKYLKGILFSFAPVRGTNFYYSYNSMGCSDFNWQSCLFSIKNFNVIIIGKIENFSCEGDKKVMEVYGVNGDKEKLIKKLPDISTYETEEVNKFDIIKNYWEKNYKSFLKGRE